MLWTPVPRPHCYLKQPGREAFSWANWKLTSDTNWVLLPKLWSICEHTFPDITTVFKIAQGILPKLMAVWLSDGEMAHCEGGKLNSLPFFPFPVPQCPSMLLLPWLYFSYLGIYTLTKRHRFIEMFQKMITIATVIPLTLSSRFILKTKAKVNK